MQIGIIGAFPHAAWNGSNRARLCPAGDTAHGEPVLKHVDFEIRAGEVVALIGRNGAGKTTLFKALQGLAKRTAGTIVIDGDTTDSWTVAARARKIAYIPQFTKAADDRWVPIPGT